MKIQTAALIIIVFAAGVLNEGATQTECGYVRGEIRLQGGRDRREGRVEVCNGLWGTVCDGGWDYRDAMVVCRQLDFLTSDTVAIATSGSHFGGGSGSTWLNDVDCDGTEDRLQDCLTDEQQRSQWLALSCDNHQRDAGVLCLDTDNGQYVRLVDGRSDREGRMEVFYEGQWGTACWDRWGSFEAEVVCRQLGLLNSESSIPLLRFQGGLSISGELFSESSTTALVNGIECGGRESNLFLCRGGAWGPQDCPSAGVACTQSTGCIEGAVRLAGGGTEREGRVEACHGGLWGTVCNGNDEWTDTDADIVCRDLGFQESNERGAQATNVAQFGLTNGLIWWFSANCRGPCTPQDWVASSCTHANDVAVTCPGEKRELHICVNVTARTLFSYGTLYSFYNTVASRIVGQVLGSCSQPCSYSRQNLFFDSSQPSPFHPTTRCIASNKTIGFRLTSWYRPRLNDNGRVQLAVFEVLGNLGNIISCANYMGYVVPKDFPITECTPPLPTPVDGSKSVRYSVTREPPTAPSKVETLTVHSSAAATFTPSSLQDAVESTLSGATLTSSLPTIPRPRLPSPSSSVKLAVHTTSTTSHAYSSYSTDSGPMNSIHVELKPQSRLPSPSSSVKLAVHTTSTTSHAYSSYSTDSGPMNSIHVELKPQSRLPSPSSSVKLAVHTTSTTNRAYSSYSGPMNSLQVALKPVELFTNIQSTVTTIDYPKVTIVHDDSSSNRNGNIINIMVTLIAVFVVLLLLLLLLLCLLVSVLLFMRKKAKKRLFQTGTGSTNPSSSLECVVQSIGDPERDTPIHSFNPLSTLLSANSGNDIYEDIDLSHEYAVLEHSGGCALSRTVPGQTPPVQSPREATSVSSLSETSSKHEYSFLDHQPQKHTTEISSERKIQEGYGETSFSALDPYSSLNAESEYAILEPEPGLGVQKPEPGDYATLEQDCDINLHHDYQRVMPDPSSDYDRTFANSTSGSFSNKSRAYTAQ